MKIKVKIEIDEYGDSFTVTSQSHSSITEAFAEVAGMAERQRRLIQNRNYRLYR